MVEVKNSNPSDNFNLEATAHEQGQVNQVAHIEAHTVIFGTAQRADKPFQAPALPSNLVVVSLLQDNCRSEKVYNLID